MKNQSYNLIEEQEITNIEQFEAHHSVEPDPKDKDDDSGYSDDEVEFADGEGTLLSEEFDEEDSEDE